jgi:hypothetical protein
VIVEIFVLALASTVRPLHSGTDKTKGIADIAGGIVALALGVAIWSGRLGAHRDDDVPVPSGGMTSRLDRRLTTRMAALAGPATHIPGLFYLIALNVIIAHEAAVGDKASALVTYNMVWVDQWTRQHARSSCWSCL